MFYNILAHLLVGRAPLATGVFLFVLLLNVKFERKSETNCTNPLHLRDLCPESAFLDKICRIVKKSAQMNFLVQGKPRKAEDSRGKPRIAEESRGKPRIAEESRGKPRKAEETCEQTRKLYENLHINEESQQNQPKPVKTTIGIRYLLQNTNCWQNSMKNH